MLTAPSRRQWFTATIAAIAMFVAGGALALSLGASGGTVAQPAGTGDALVQEDDPPAECGDRNCDIEEGEPGTPGNPGNGNPGGGNGGCYFNNGGGVVTVGSDAGPAIVFVAQDGLVQVPCVHPTMGFYADGCFWGEPPSVVYVDTMPDAPPDGQTDGDGRWYWGSCIGQVIGELPNQDYIIFAVIRWQWFENGAVPTVTPEQVAQDWLASVTLDGVEFDLAPPAETTGVVHLPIWLGVNEASANTWGTIEDNHCLQGVCVDIEALVVTVDWTMGNGATVTCTREQHVAWEQGMNYLQPGGNCHYEGYRDDSRGLPDEEYTITANSHWEVRWASDVSDATGVLETDREASTALQIDTIRVLTR